MCDSTTVNIPRTVPGLPPDVLAMLKATVGRFVSPPYNPAALLVCVRRTVADGDVFSDVLSSRSVPGSTTNSTEIGDRSNRVYGRDEHLIDDGRTVAVPSHQLRQRSPGFHGSHRRLPKFGCRRPLRLVPVNPLTASTACSTGAGNGCSGARR